MDGGETYFTVHSQRLRSENWRVRVLAVVPLTFLPNGWLLCAGSSCCHDDEKRVVGERRVRGTRVKSRSLNSCLSTCHHFPVLTRPKSVCSPDSLCVLLTKRNAVRANQRDLFHVFSFKEQTESVLRSWLGERSSFACMHALHAYLIYLLGTRWLLRWDKEVDLVLKLLYYGLTIGRGSKHTCILHTVPFADITPKPYRLLEKNTPTSSSILRLVTERLPELFG